MVAQSLDSQGIVQSVRQGAYDVLLASDTGERWKKALKNAKLAQETWHQLYGPLSRINHEDLVGSAELIAQLRKSIERVGPAATNVLVVDASGTGKDELRQRTFE